MRITSVIEHNGEPAIRITDAPTTEALYRTKIKAFCTGVTLEGFKSAIHDESGDIIGITRFYDVNEQVAFIAEPVRPDDIEAWFASPRSIPLLDFLTSRSSEGPAPETDNTPAEDQSEENMITSPGCGESECRICGGKLKPWEVDCCDKCKEDQDHEPEVETDVVQNDDETVETRELTDLQRSVMRCLSMEDCSVADIAEAMGRTTNSDKVQIRKTCHDLVDMGLAVKKDVIIQNGRPAQIWGVM